MAIMKTLLIIFFLGIANVLGHDKVKSDVTPYNTVETVSKSSNSFGFAMLRELTNTQNVFISPISISMLMGLVYSGSRNSTAAEIQRVMRYPLSVHEDFKQILDVIKPPEAGKINKKDYNLEMANAMLVDKAFILQDRYKDESRKYYDAAVESVSFSLDPEEAVESVNGWVAWRTKNKISKVLETPFDPLTKLFLINAVYFKGTWKTKFDQRFTMPDTFYNQGTVPKTVPMMRQKGKLKYGFDTRLQTHTLEIPYNGDDIRMLLLLPEKRDGLPELEVLLSNELIKEISKDLREVIVQVTLPRFSLLEEYDLIPVLKQMGIYSLFDSEKADLSGISFKKGLYVTKAVHKCALEVNEEGSEAASVTGVSAGVRTGGPLVPVFNADHPFIFFIRDSRTDITLFIGRVTNL